MTDYITIMTTTDSVEAAVEISSTMVRKRLVACAQRIAINSVYEWEGEVHDDAEYLILLKTNARNQEAAVAEIASVHNYDEPEILVLPILDGSSGYFAWIDKVTG
jgi:periplasmic divalent cation tolerance protein